MVCVLCFHTLCLPKHFCAITRCFLRLRLSQITDCSVYDYAFYCSHCIQLISITLYLVYYRFLLRIYLFYSMDLEMLYLGSTPTLVAFLPFVLLFLKVWTLSDYHTLFYFPWFHKINLSPLFYSPSTRVRFTSRSPNSICISSNSGSKFLITSGLFW